MAGRSGVFGAKETRAALKELERFVGVPANEAARYALAPMLAEAKANVPVKTGLLRRSLTIIRDRRSPKLNPTFRVGPSADVVGPDGAKPVKYAHVVEFGRIGVPGTRFLTAAFEATKELVAKRFGERMGPALLKRASQLAKRVR